MIIAVTGSRNWQGYDLMVGIVEGYLGLEGAGPEGWHELNPYVGDGFVHVGDCPTGADAMLREYMELCQVPHRVHRADWDTYGPSAGPRRNRAMLDSDEGIELLLAFREGSKSKGTDDCIRAAHEREIAVLTIEASHP